MEDIKKTFAKCRQQKRSALVTYVTAGYPTIEETVDVLLALENGGAGTLIAPSLFDNTISFPRAVLGLR